MIFTPRKRQRPATRPTRPRTRLALMALENRTVPSTAYLPKNLVSDQAGNASIHDPNLINAWGIAVNPASGGFWVASNGGDVSTVYTGDVNGQPLAKSKLEVSIPDGAPTGIVFNGTSGFVISSGANSGPARFILVTESGKIVGWNPNVAGTSALTAFKAEDGAIYKGVALGARGGESFLYAADFHNGKIDVFDSKFRPMPISRTAFADTNMPEGFAPFNIVAIGDKLFVTYAKQDDDQEDDVAGPGFGFVDVYDTSGALLQRFASKGTLNAPWAVVQAPEHFGDFSGDVLIGN